MANIRGLAPSHGAQSERSAETTAEPLAWLAEAHRDQLALCGSLEAIADSLPKIDREICSYAARMLGPLLRELHAGEEGLVFAWLESRHGDDPSLAAMLEELKYEHCEDECYAEEVTEMLARLGAADASANAETAGYMLRGFFTSVRRHITFEQECLRGILARRRDERPGKQPA
ncbi:hemerythrin-like domain-containing protein [Sinorhizobium fredii]|uniref:Hemerythrin-like domain-containing protein n=1 Tax=Sinorhizobium fredii (strain USDA 257) TaxID=1185652 RepID=I3X964_SINF2|nr:hemerythrin domain-containing protein [Sinorhizobium fredii]AFL52420.1 hypothetical protein USDA257_c38750 [Sinorhizobium fredii USDA 257]